MRSVGQLERELDGLVRASYYEEDYELLWTLRRFGTSLAREEYGRFCEIAIRRLADDPSILSVIIVSAVRIPTAVPLLCSILDGQRETGVLTRAILSALREYGDPASFPSVERLLDSDQEQEALSTLARIDFSRSLFYVIRSAEREYLLDASIHVLHEEKKSTDISRLIRSLGAHARISDQPVVERVEMILRCKSGDFNPFTEQEIEKILTEL